MKGPVARPAAAVEAYPAEAGAVQRGHLVRVRVGVRVGAGI